MKMPLNLAVCLCTGLAVLALVGAEDPYRFFNWNVTYGDIYPLGVKQQVCYFFFPFFFGGIQVC